MSLHIGKGKGMSTITAGEVNQSSPTLADSFFDVLFELDRALGTPVFNINPVYIAAETIELAIFVKPFSYTPISAWDV